MKRHIRMLAVSAAAVSLLAPVASGLEKLDITCKAEEPCRVDETNLPMRVLPRPNSTIMAEPDADSEIVTDNLRALFPLYVYTRQDVDLSDPTDPKGWYQVGATDSRPVGWMAARDVMEWRQPMVVSYMPRGADADARKPVLGFSDLETLESILESEDRLQEAGTRYEALGEGKVPDGVVTAEPSGAFIDINDQFYIWPVLDWQLLSDYFDEPVRYLQLTTSVPGERATGSGPETLESAGRMAEVAGMAPAESAGRLDGEVNVDLVFVMDLTSSMQPFIGQTKDALDNIRLKINEDIDDRVSFGFVGYRDSAEVIPEMEYTAKSYTPDLLDANAFSELLDQEVEVTTASSRDYAEEMFAGVKTAIESNWSEGKTVKLVVVVGDASSHPTGHPQNTTGLDASGLRELASTNGVNIISMHLRDPENNADWARATQQMSQIAMNTGDEADLIPVDATDEAAYTEAARQIAEVVVSVVDGGASSLAAGDGEAESADADAGDGGSAGGATGDKAKAVAERVLSGALMDIIGDDVEADRDITYWVADRDITDPSKVALDVRILLTRSQLDNLIRSLEDVLNTFIEAETLGASFMDTLKAVVTGAATGEDLTFEEAERLGGTRVMPNWIAYLPYKSQVMGLSDAMVESMTADESARFRQSLEDKIKYYRTVSETDAAWHKLNEDDGSLEMVTALPMRKLP